MGKFKSFGDWCIEHGQEIYLDYWDYEENKISPYEIASRSHTKFAFKCSNPDHPKFYKCPDSIVISKNTVVCPACNSFGQYVIDTNGKDYLDKIWSEKNTLSYYEVSKRSGTTKIWLKCLNNKNHPDYEIPPNTFYLGCGCPYCAGRKVCYENSLLHDMPEITEVWSDKNIKGPDEYTKCSQAKVWLKCSNNLHDDFQRQISNIKLYGTKCPICSAKEAGMARREDLTGRTFGRLTVLGLDPDSNGYDGLRYICECNCENHTIKSILGCHLTSGKITSCGCYWHEQISGENNHAWKGGISGYNHEGRKTLEYTTWHEDVLKRDNYTCQCCGTKSNFEVHHIYNFSDHEDLRYDTLNGITLCYNCHSAKVQGAFHQVYGTTNNTPEQLEEFINNKREELGIEEHFSLDEYIRESKEKENMANERECKICKATYKYCPHCSSFKNAPKWMALFDKEVCKNVFDIISGYNTGSIAPEDAKAKLAELDLSGIEFKENIQAKIDEINGVVNQNAEQVDNGEPQTIEYKPGRGRKRKKAEEPVDEEANEPVAEQEVVVVDSEPEEQPVENAAEAVENVNNNVSEE